MAISFESFCFIPTENTLRVQARRSARTGRIDRWRILLDKRGEADGSSLLARPAAAL